VPHLVWVATPDGVVREYSRRIERYAAARAEAGDGWRWESMVHPDDLEEVLAGWEATAQVGLPFDMEYRMIHRDGRVIWVHDQAVSVLSDGRYYAEGVFYDVTARRTAERALIQA